MALGDKERAKELLEKSSSETVKYYEQNTRQIHLKVDGKDGESVAFLEVPKYVDKEIEKAIDVEVDELISNRKDLPDVVLKSLYDESLATIASQSLDIERLESDVADLTAQLASMTAQRDNEKELRIAAELALAELENLYVALSDQFQDTTIELQRAIERSTQEAVERVSLEARFEAIKARLAASLLAIEIAEEQIEEEQKTNLVEVVLGENGNLGQASYKAFPSGDVLLYVKNAEDRNMLSPSDQWSFDSGMIRWLNKDNSPKNHLNGRIDNGGKAELRIKSISEESVTIRYDGFTIKDKGHNAKTGNKGVKNVDNKTAGPFDIYKGNYKKNAGATWTAPAVTVVEGEQTQPVDGEIITFGGAGDLNKKSSGRSDAGAVGVYTFTWVEKGETIEIPWAAKQLQADRK